MITEEVIAHLSKDEKFRLVLASTNLVIPPVEKPDLYLSLVRSITGQQLSVKAATTIYNRFLNLFEENYPHPAQVLALDADTLRSVGLSRQKSTYIQNVADYFQRSKLQHHEWVQQSDEEILTELTQIKGVGKWTVEMILMFTMQRPDIFPVNDLGIQQGMMRLYSVEGKGKILHKQLTEIAEAWRPYRTVACRYIWHWKDTAPMNEVR